MSAEFDKRRETNPLPPLAQYPQWSRGTLLQETPKPIVVRQPPQGTSLAGRADGVNSLRRIYQLEQNIQFLKEQHEVMIRSLHEEIEKLRERNRDMQLQLVLGGNQPSQNFPPSPEDDGSDIPGKIYINTGVTNSDPLKVEMLENDIRSLQTALSEARSRNEHLTKLLEEQKRAYHELLLTHDRQKQEWEHERDALAPPRASEYVTKLEEAERIILQLKKENEEQKKEMIRMKSNMNHSLEVREAHVNNLAAAPPLEQSIETGARRKNQFPPLRSEQQPRSNKPKTEFPPVQRKHNCNINSSQTSLEPRRSVMTTLPSLRSNAVAPAHPINKPTNTRKSRKNGSNSDRGSRK